MAKVILADPVRCANRESHWEMRFATVQSGTSLAYRDPIGIEYIASYLKARRHVSLVVAQGPKSNEEFIAQIVEQKPDIVGFSVWTYNVGHVLNLAQGLKKLSPRTKVIVGGYHPTGDPLIVLNRAIDFAVIGEGEAAIDELASAEQARLPQEEIKGIAFCQDNELVLTPPRKRLDFSRIPWPLRSEAIMKLSRISGLTYPCLPRQRAAAQISYSRGCSQRCKFCPSGALWNHEVRYRCAEDVVEEMAYLAERYTTNYVYFSDLTFNLREDRLQELCQAILNARLPMYWSAMLKIGTSRKTLELMAEAGCTRVAYGVEVLDQSHINEIKPGETLDQVRDELEVAGTVGLIVRCFLLMGFPWENEGIIGHTLRVLQGLPVDNVRVAFVVPFPGTAYHAEWKRFSDKDYSRYTGEYPVVANASMSPERLQTLRRSLIKAFYDSSLYRRRVRAKIRRFPFLAESFSYFLKTEVSRL